MFNFSRTWVIYAVAIPLALVLGCLVSSPNIYSISVLGVILLFFALPLFFKWHHTLLILFWSSAFNAFFLPGSPDFWLLFTAISIGISVLNHVMIQKKFLRVPELNYALFLAFVVLFTALYRGGIGVRSLGGAVYGGRYYIYILGAILGYFALTAQGIPLAKSGRMASLYFLSGTTYALSNLAFVLGPAFFFLYYFVPSGPAVSQAASAYGLSKIDRIEGLGQFGVALLCFMLLIYSARGFFIWTKPWRMVFLCLTIASNLFAGYRSVLMLLFLILAFQFYFEGLLRTRYFAMAAGFVILALIPIMAFSDRMPASVQRTLSFLPVKLDSEVKADARASSEWRFQMWAVVWRDVPKYLLIGKGYGIDPTELFLTVEGVRTGMLESWEEAMLAGDYHSGPLSVLVPFGIMGVLGFIWVLAAGGWVLYSNFQYGDPRLRRINTVLLSFYLSYCFSFFFVFGAFNTQLYVFLGAIGLNVSFNGGVHRKPMPKPARRGVEQPPQLIVLEPGLPEGPEV